MELRIEITAADIDAARRAWEAASAQDDQDGRTELLRADFVQLISTQAQQIADDFRRQRRAS